MSGLTLRASAAASLALLAALAAPCASAAAQAPPSAARDLYRLHCASCHGADRLGASGPALLPESLGRLRREAAARAISAGRDATQMPAFAGALGEGEIAALVDYLYSAPSAAPRWGAQEMEASRTVSEGHGEWPAEPAFDADPLNLFVVVESGDHHVTILDGDGFEPIHRFKSRRALHGGPKFSRDGRFVFLASRDGWISKFDLYALRVAAEVRAGINTRNIALSPDGDFLAVANYLPRTLVILDARDLGVARIFEARGRGGEESRVGGVYQAPARNGFVAALKDAPEIWEIAVGPGAAPASASASVAAPSSAPIPAPASASAEAQARASGGGLARPGAQGMAESAARGEALFALRRIALEEPLDDFFFDRGHRHLIGSSREGNRAVVVDLERGAAIASIDLPGFPHLGSGITWSFGGREVMATPHLREARVSVVDMKDWSVIETIETLGPGFFMRSHESTPYAWTDVFFGPNRDAVHVIDKRTLEIAATLRPSPGKTAAHVEFTRDGSHALVSVWETDGAIVVYDAKTFEEVKRIPMSRPSGKYNVRNKIAFSPGTSH